VLFERRANDENDQVVMICNFTAVPRHEYRVGVPTDGYWAELLNTDAAVYGGSNLGNDGGVWAQAEPTHAQPYSLVLTLPPLAALILKCCS
jgi:1,4-alpha-glucan branching enzyme